MGDPKKQRRKYRNPRFAWSKNDLDAELRLLGEYGLRNKRELRRHRLLLSKYRTMARTLLAETSEERAMLRKQILRKLTRLKIVPPNADLDAILDLSVEQILERRLQTIIYRQELSKTPQQARQLIVHGHITVRGHRVTCPSYLVSDEEEQTIKCLIAVPS